MAQKVARSRDEEYQKSLQEYKELNKTLNRENCDLLEALSKMRLERDEFKELLVHFCDEGDDQHDALPLELRREWMDRLGKALGWTNDM